MHLIKIELLTIVLLGLLVIGLLFAYYSRKRVYFSRFITLTLMVYGFIATELLVILSTVTHYHSIRHIHVHIMRLLNENGDQNIIPLTHLTIFVLLITAVIFILGFLFSQVTLNILSKYLVKNSNFQLQKELLTKITWLPKKYNLIIINNIKAEAYSFTLIRRDKFRFYAQDWIIVSSKLLKLLTDDELEMVIAHEYSHLSEYDTRYSHLIYTIMRIMFFDPVLRIFRTFINYRHEIDADLQAVKMIEKPKTLARALLKLVKSSQYKRLSITTGLGKSKKQLILKRIDILIKYAERNHLKE